MERGRKKGWRPGGRIWPRLATTALAVLLCAAGAFGWGGAALAAGGDMKWEAFKEEYERLLEQDRFGDSQTLKLTGDLTVSEDFTFGRTEGRLVLEAGPHELRVTGGHSLLIDNPNLAIQASGGGRPFLTLDGGSLSLRQGTITVNGRAALLLEAGSFKLDAPSNGLRIQCTAGAGGGYPYAITSKLNGHLTLRGLTLNAMGGIQGIQSKGSLRLEWCKVNVSQATNQPAVSSKEGSVVMSASQVSPSPPSGGGVVVEPKDTIVLIEKPAPCFLLGNTDTSQVKGKLPAKVAAEVQAPDGSRRSMQLEVDWKVSTLPTPMVYGGNAYVLEGQIPEYALMREEVVNPSGQKTSLNLLTVKRGPIENLQGVARWKAGDRVEVELWLPYPNEPTELYLERSLDQQNWVVDKEPALDANGRQEETDNLWRVLTGSEKGMVDPAAVRSDGKVRLVCELDLTKEQAVRGFWVRLRLGGSEYAGISNACRFKLRSSGGQGGRQSVWSFQSDTGDYGGGQAAGNPDAVARPNETEPSSEPESDGSDGGARRHGGGGQQGPEGTEPEDGGGGRTPPEPSDGNDGGQGGGRAGGSFTSHRGGWYGSDSPEMEEEPHGKAGWLALAVVGGAVLLAVFLLYRKWLKKYM